MTVVISRHSLVRLSAAGENPKVVLQQVVPQRPSRSPLSPTLDWFSPMLPPNQNKTAAKPECMFGA